MQRNYAHDTQGYCVAVFAAGYVTSESVVRDNLCIDNGLSPRLSRLQGAIYLHTWNEGTIRGLQIEGNTIQWNPPVSDAAAVVNDALIDGRPATFRNNLIVSAAPRIYRSNARFDPSSNKYRAGGEPLFTLGNLHDVKLAALQAAGKEAGSTLAPAPLSTPAEPALSMEAFIDLPFDADGLLAPGTRAQWIVLRDLAGQYASGRLTVAIHLINRAESSTLTNALRDLDGVYPGALQVDRDVTAHHSSGSIYLWSSDGKLIQEWHGFQNAATLGGAVRLRLGPPHYAHMQKLSPLEDTK